MSTDCPLTLIAAHDQNRAIGRGGTIPWHLPEELAHFATTTKGGTLVMGRHTWDSLPKKPLPNRPNIVVSSRANAAPITAPDIPHALLMARATRRPIFGIGGAGVYQALLPVADRLVLTTVDLAVAGADTFFPPIDPQDWVLLSEQLLRREAPACTVRTYARRSQPPKKFDT